MNEPFLPTGFKDVPWYGIFGNHDGLVQGNQNRNAALDAIATGCVKVDRPARRARRSTPAGLRDALIAGRRPSPSLTRTVPQDPRRHLLFKREYIAAALRHLRHAGRPRLHAGGPRAAGEGYYAFSPRPGLRFVVLDSVSDAGGDGGNIDDGQFAWLDGQLGAADAAGELTLVFAHHTLETMNQAASPFPPGDNPPPPHERVHLGETSPAERAARTRRARRDGQVPVPAPPDRDRLRHRPRAPHASASRARAARRRARREGGFWQVTTASHIDWPQQSRLLDLVDNGDGTRLDLGHDPRPRRARRTRARAWGRRRSSSPRSRASSPSTTRTPTTARTAAPTRAGARATATWSWWCATRARAASSPSGSPAARPRAGSRRPRSRGLVELPRLAEHVGGDQPQAALAGGRRAALELGQQRARVPAPAGARRDEHALDLARLARRRARRPPQATGSSPS